MKKLSVMSILTISLSTVLISYPAIAQKRNQPVIDSVYQEMIDSPDIFDPEPYIDPEKFKLPDDAKAILMDDGLARIPVVDEISFPFHSEGVTSAQFAPYLIDDPNFYMGEIPLCIIGTDDTSKKWLELRKNELFEHGVTCIVVEAKNEKNINDLQKIAPKIFFNAMDGSWLPHAHINHYPAIIYNRQVFQ